MVAIAASSLDRATKVAERLGIPRAYGDWRQLVTAPDVDVVSIAVPPVAQPFITIAAAGAGKAILCEKPVASDAASAERMLAAVRRARVANAVDFEFAELRAWQEVKRALHDGVIGRTRSCAMTWHVQTRVRPQVSWKERVEAGGGAAGGFASHLLYLAEWCLGPVAKVALRSAPGRVTVFEARLETVDGCACTIDIVTDAAVPTGLTARFDGDIGAVVISGGIHDHVRGYSVAVTESGGGTRVLKCDDRQQATEDPRVDAVAPLVSRFLDSVLYGEQMRPDLAAGVRVQRLIDALLGPSERDGWVVV